MASINSNGTGGGNWSAGASWSGGVAPVIGDKATILAGDTITVNTTGLGGGDDTSTGVNVNGILRFSRAANSDLTVRGQLVIGAAGELDMGKQGDAITFVATLNLNDSASPSVGEWGLNVTNAGSKVYANGNARTARTKLAANAIIGATSISVLDVTGWQNGDTIIVVGSTSARNDNEVRTINGAITGTGPYSVPLSAALTAAHASGIDVGHFNANVTIKAANTSYRSYVNLKHGYAGSGVAGNIQLQNVALRYIGAFGGANQCLELGQAAAATPAVYAQFNNLSIYESQNVGLGLYAMDYLATFKIAGLAVHASNSSCFYNDNAGNFQVEDFVFINTGGNPTHSGGNAAPSGALLLDGTYSPTPDNHLSTPSINTEWRDVRFMSCARFYLVSSGHEKARFTNCRICYSDVGTPSGDSLYNFNFTKSADIVFEDCLTNTVWTYNFKLQPASPFQRITWANYQQDPTAQEIYTDVGNVIRDNSVGFDSVTPSQRFAPFSDVTPLMRTFQILAPSGALVTVSGKIKQNFATAGATRVTLSGLGITPSVWTSAADGTNWQTFVVSGTQASGATSLFTLTVETFNASYSTSGTNKVWLDAIAAPSSVALNTGDIGVWFDGHPAELITANYVTAADVWGSQTAVLNLAGSIGKLLVDNVDAAISSRLAAAGYSAPPSSAANAAAVWQRLIEVGLTAEEILRLLASFAAGDASGLEGGAPVFRDLADTKDRIVATYSAGTRAVSARDGT